MVSYRSAAIRTHNPYIPKGDGAYVNELAIRVWQFRVGPHGPLCIIVHKDVYMNFRELAALTRTGPALSQR
jgi:hypothetical protein